MAFDKLRDVTLEVDNYVEEAERFDKHKREWQQRHGGRKDPNHKHFNKPMPRMIPPNFVCLFQIALSQIHNKKFMEHFGYMLDVEDGVHQDVAIQVIAERHGVAASAAVATSFQTRVLQFALMMRALPVTWPLG